MDIIKPKEPRCDGWIKGPDASGTVGMGYQAQYWIHKDGSILVISAIEVATTEGKEDIGPEYHLSMSVQTPSGPQRIRSKDAKWVLRAFDMDDATEDNHVPNGIARNFWRPVADKFSGYQCPCVDEEPAMIEDKGDYVWRGRTK